MNLKLHGHPQRLVYTDPSQFTRPSFQGHFSTGDDNPVLSSHVHVEPLFPLYAELGAQEVDVPFTLQLHHFHGRIGGFFGENIQRVVWDKTGTATPPLMIGDPEGDLLWSGVATVDISKASNGDDRFAAKTPGWGMTRFGARVYFGDVPDDNNRADVCGWCPVYSIVNPDRPETPSQPAGTRGILSCRVDAFTLANKNDSGTMVMEYQDFLPIMPIDKPWTAPISAYNYTGSRETAGAFELRRDVDFHHGNPGIVDAITIIGRSGVNRTVTFDPLMMGNGLHKEAAIWRQAFTTGVPESVWSLITFPVSVGDVAMPPPQLCGDPKALNFGQPLPCLYAPPADPFQPFPASFKRIPGTNRVQVCDSNGVAIGEISFKP